MGLVGYVYKERLGQWIGRRVGCFQSRVVGIGPQFGYVFPVGGLQGYIDLKVYGEFDALGSALRLERVADPGHLVRAAPVPGASPKPILTK